MQLRLDERYHKTDAGRAEIKTRSLVAARGARNLLLLIDPSRSAQAWLEAVQGALGSDLQTLLTQGLIEPQSTPAPLPAPASPGVLDHAQLYAYLTRHAKPYLGLIKGYKTVLEVERCQDLVDLRILALRFVEQVRLAQGEELAQQVRRALGLA